MTATLPKKTIGKLAQARRPRGPLIETRDTPLFYQAIEQIDGWTYPTLGHQIALYSKMSGIGVINMSREVHVAQPSARKLALVLSKKGGG